MKTKLLTLTAIAASLLLGSNSSAITINDATYRDIDLVMIDLTLDNPVISGHFFDLVGDDGDGRDRLFPDFEPNKYVVTEAVVGFLFAEFSDNFAPVASRLVFDIGSYFTNTNSSGGSASFEGESMYEVQFNSNVYGLLSGNLFLDIQDDGRVDWTVSLSSQDRVDGVRLKLFSAYLGVNATSRAVPDVGSTSAMLGLAIFGMAFIRRRQR